MKELLLAVFSLLTQPTEQTHNQSQWPLFEDTCEPRPDIVSTQFYNLLYAGTIVISWFSAVHIAERVTANSIRNGVMARIAMPLPTRIRRQQDPRYAARPTQCHQSANQR